MGFTKITPADLQGKGVVGLPDTPQLSALAMQQKFDEIANDVIVPKFNNLVDELDTQGGTNIEVTDPTTSTTDTLQNALDHIEAENALNTADRHNHANKATLDDIDATTKQGYDDLVTLMTNITGIDDVALSSDNDKIPTSKSVDDAIDTVQAEVSLNTAARHTHTNKSVLDAITGTMTTAWDALVTMFTGITAVEKTTLDNSATKIPNDKVVKDAIDTVQAEVSLNTAARHTHTNKATLDAIDATTKSAYDSLVTNYGSTSLEQTVTNDADKVPSGAAVVDYVSALGGGDMLKATYDTNDDGTVDSADYATNAGHATTADSATSATSAASATYATSAGSATSATTATSATNADYATSAGDSSKLGGKYSSFYAEAGDLQTLFGDVATYQSTSTALRNYAVGDFMIYENNFYEVTKAIASGGTIVKNTNVTKKTVGEVLTALASATPADMTGATSLLPGTHGLVPAPQAGDEDKVLRGDGTWGTAGDTATVRYDEATQWIQCKDSLGWFNWRKATRAEWDAIRDHETFTFYVEPGESASSDYTASQSWSGDVMVLTLKSKVAGGGFYTALMIAGNNVGNANMVHIKGNVSHSNTSYSPAISFTDASTKTWDAGLHGTRLQRISGNGDFEFDAPISANTYVAVSGNSSQTSAGADVITINITEMYSYTA